MVENRLPGVSTEEETPDFVFAHEPDPLGNQPGLVLLPRIRRRFADSPTAS
jgi:hypothetical protein